MVAQTHKFITMKMDRIFVIAYNNDEHNTLAYLMIQLYAQYVEGEIESSKDKFNFIFRDLTHDTWAKMREQNKTIGFSGLDKIIDLNIGCAPNVRPYNLQ